MNELLTIADELLDEMISHDAVCTSLHNIPGDETCSVEPTHRYRVPCASIDKLICANSARAVSEISARNRRRCWNCKRALKNCWSVTPA